MENKNIYALSGITSTTWNIDITLAKKIARNCSQQKLMKKNHGFVF